MDKLRNQILTLICKWWRRFTGIILLRNDMYFHSNISNGNNRSYFKELIRKFNPNLHMVKEDSLDFFPKKWHLFSFSSILTMMMLSCFKKKKNGNQKVLFIPFPIFIICRLFGFGHSCLCEMVPHCSFNLLFSSN